MLLLWQFLDSFKLPKEVERELLLSVARTSLSTKLNSTLATSLTPAIVDAVLAICMFHVGTVCILCKPTAMVDRLEKFCSILLKFHSNFDRIPVQIF